MTIENKLKLVKQYFENKGHYYAVESAENLNSFYKNVDIDEDTFLDSLDLFHLDIRHDVAVVLVDDLAHETFAFSYLDQPVDKVISDIIKDL